MFFHEVEWSRPAQPCLSALLTERPWPRVQIMSPTVVRARGRYLMWFTGNNSETRTADEGLGLATSDDGLQWTEHPDNPILRGEDLPFGTGWATPRVLYDEARDRFQMWFVSGSGRKTGPGNAADVKQTLGYAESADGIRWEIRPEPLWPQFRGPCLLREPDGGYRLWGCAAPTPDGDFQQVVGRIYGFRSSDGLRWEREAEPCITPGRGQRSVVYPFVVRDGGDYTMWYGAHVAGGIFELFCATSRDGAQWTPHVERSCFPASRDECRFDGRYTSMPCVLVEPDRLLLYFATRDLGRLYRAGDGALKADPSGVYRHLGVAAADAVTPAAEG